MAPEEAVEGCCRSGIRWRTTPLGTAVRRYRARGAGWREFCVSAPGLRARGGPGKLSVAAARVYAVAGVFDRLVGQDAVESELTAAAVAARSGVSSSAMTHSW